MSALCFICLNGDCNLGTCSNDNETPTYARGRRKRQKMEDGHHNYSNSVRILTTYLLQTSKSSTRNNGDMDELQTHILSSFGNGKFSICSSCLAKSNHLMDLHLELEAIQMQILDVLKGLQDYLVARKAVKVEEIMDLENDGIVMFTRFQDVLLQKFVHRDLSDGSQVRLERLETMGFEFTNPVSISLPKGIEDVVGVFIPRPRFTDDLECNNDDDDEEDIEDTTSSFGESLDNEANASIHDADLDYIGSGEDMDMDDPSFSPGETPREKIKTKLPKGKPASLNEIEAWECDICLENIPSDQHELHLQTHPEFEKHYKCEGCPRKEGRKFGTFRGLVWHYLKRRHPFHLRCRLCLDQSSSLRRWGKQELWQHLYDVHYVNPKTVQCETEGCSEEFYDHFSLQYHQMQGHTTEAMKYTCDLCPKSFKKKSMLHFHKRDIHGKHNQFRCASCDKDCKSAWKLREHEKTHKKRKVPAEFVDCPHCWARVKCLDKHIKRVHEAEPDPNRVENPNRKIWKPLVRECDICLENIPYRELDDHLKSHFDEFEKHYICELCPHVRKIRYTRKYGTYKGLVWHYMRANHRGKFPCKLCPDQDTLYGRIELCKHLYDSHYQNHKKLPCKSEGCSDEFYDPFSRRDHQMRQHPEPEDDETKAELYSCEVCGITYKKKWALNKHKKRVHDHTEKVREQREEERYQCASCPKNFKNSGSLRNHEKTHEEGWVPKPKAKVPCPQCTKLVCVTYMKEHIKTLHGESEKSFVCRFCGKAFGSPKHLKRHEEAHQGEKKYKCSKCSYAGTTHTSLWRHMTLHRERTFQCRYCPKSFPIKRYWEDHERTHTKEKPYQCDHCEMSFNARNMLSAHRRKKHGIAAVQQCLAGVGVLQREEEEEQQHKDVKVGNC